MNEYSLTIYQGSTFSFQAIWKDALGVPVDLTGYVARMQVRKSVSAAEVIVELTTENGCIVLGDAAGTINLILTATQTESLVAKSGVYDLELESPDQVVVRLLYGSVEVSMEVTR